MSIDPRTYLKSLGQELDALKQRVRYLLATPHWQTDGEWKESVLRQVLRRHLPATAIVGRGFVVTGDTASHQLDVLVHDASKPVLFRDGDLVFVTPDAVLGIIEVKSRVTHSIFNEAAGKLAHDINLVRLHPNSHAFAGLFAFESEGEGAERYLDCITTVATRWNERLDFAALGPDRFIKYWHFDPADQSRMYDTWHSYRLPGLASGYFVHNVVDAVSPESVFRNSDVWFPRDGKEPQREAHAKARWP